VLRSSDRWVMAELRIHVPALTPQGRDALVAWLRDKAVRIEKFKCEDNYDWNQPDRLHKLKVGY